MVGETVAMPVTDLTLERFGPFGRAAFPLSPGVNVLLGENSTGKTFAAKALYALLAALGPERQSRPAASRRELVRDKLAGVFRPDDGDVRRLVSRTPRGTSGRILVTLAVALDAAALRGRRPAQLRAVADRLERALGGKVRRRGPRFYLESRNRGAFEAHLMAEGFRKIASIVHLIANGALRQGGLLIWDEPEANLHPRLAEVVVECLASLADGGVQVIIATHDYLIADAISRWAQYRPFVEWSAPVRFFQLLRDDEGDVRVDVADTFVKLPANPLLDAFLEHHDREQDLIVRQLTQPARRRRRA